MERSEASWTDGGGGLRARQARPGRTWVMGDVSPFPGPADPGLGAARRYPDALILLDDPPRPPPHIFRHPAPGKLAKPPPFRLLLLRLPIILVDVLPEGRDLVEQVVEPDRAFRRSGLRRSKG